MGIAKQIAEVLGEDQGNIYSNDPQFCIGLQSGVG